MTPSSMRAALARVDQQHEEQLDEQDTMVLAEATDAWSRAVWTLTPETYDSARSGLVQLVVAGTIGATQWFSDVARQHVAEELDVISPEARRVANGGGSLRSEEDSVWQLARGLVERLDVLVSGATDVPGVLLAEVEQVLRIVQTESFRSYNGTRALMMAALSAGGDRREYVVSVEQSQARALRDASDWIPGILKIWSATLDRRACPRCVELARTVRLLGASFDGEANPPLHPRCRCRVAFFPIVVPKPK